MNGEGGYTIDVNAFRRGLSFCVDFNPSEYGRVVHSDSRVESAARLRWASALAANSTLFNASKFRYAGCVVDELARTVTLRLGLTNYAEFQGTHSAPRPCELFGPEGLARPLGNAIIVETTDERVPFLCRATHSGEGRGVITVTGGHPEPDDAGVFSDALIGEDSNQRVSDELWNAARKEVLEELFVPNSSLAPACDMKFLGLVSRSYDLKTLVAFWAALRMTSDELRHIFFSRNSKMESTDLLLVHKTKLHEILETGVVDGKKVMPDHMGALALACDFFDNSVANELAEPG